jgi:hypothetical protein
MSEIWKNPHVQGMVVGFAIATGLFVGHGSSNQSHSEADPLRNFTVVGPHEGGGLEVKAHDPADVLSPLGRRTLGEVAAGGTLVIGCTAEDGVLKVDIQAPSDVQGWVQTAGNALGILATSGFQAAVPEC